MWHCLKAHIAVLMLLCWGVTIAQASSDQAVWIDTDPACGQTKFDDVDDCWAILLAMRSDGLKIRGISTLFGNSSGESSYLTATKLIQRFGSEESMPMIYRGADQAIGSGTPDKNEATDALAKVLSKEPLTIIALGPLTNIAALILRHPEHLANIRRVIAIAGQRPEPGIGFYPGTSRLFHLHDLNFRKDVAAFRILLQSSIPVTLVPYEAAAKISILSPDLALLEKGDSQSRWLSKVSKPWLQFWNNKLGAKGFFPFDSLAIGLVTFPSHFTCENISAKIQYRRTLFLKSRDNLLVSHDFKEKRYVEYCHDIDQSLKSELISELL